MINNAGGIRDQVSEIRHQVKGGLIKRMGDGEMGRGLRFDMCKIITYVSELYI
jgi:hypothetical protein